MKGTDVMSKKMFCAKLKYAVILAFCLFSLALTAQEKKTKIYVDRAREISYSKTESAQRLVGDVALRHDSARFFCDTAFLYENSKSMKAYGNVHIIANDSVDIYSNRMNYDGNTRFAEFFGNVRLMDDSTLLVTEYLTYDRDAHKASYPNHAITTRGHNTLESVIGCYYDNIKEMSFFDSVVLTSPDYTMNTDTLHYNMNIEKMWFNGPTTIVHEENTLKGKYGYYLENEELVYLDKRPFFFNKTQTLEADSMYYYRANKFVKAMSDVEVVDTSYCVVMLGDYAELWRNRGFSFVTDSTHAIYYDEGDSLHIHADTMFFYFKSDLNEEEKMLGYYNVRFYKSDMQGKCDSMAYNISDSTLLMRGKPILWSEESQMSSDSINILIANHKIDTVWQYGNAFIVSRDTIEGFNQIKGTSMISLFDDGTLSNVKVTDEAQTIYWLREEDGSLVGINTSKSKSMNIIMKKEGQGVSHIKYYGGIDETLFPEKDINEKERYLAGFKWLDEIRPKSIIDIFKLTDAAVGSQNGQSFGEINPSDDGSNKDGKPQRRRKKKTENE